MHIHQQCTNDIFICCRGRVFRYWNIVWTHNFISVNQLISVPLKLMVSYIYWRPYVCVISTKLVEVEFPFWYSRHEILLGPTWFCGAIITNTSSILGERQYRYANVFVPIHWQPGSILMYANVAFVISKSMDCNRLYGKWLHAHICLIFTFIHCCGRMGYGHIMWYYIVFYFTISIVNFSCTVLLIQPVLLKRKSR